MTIRQAITSQHDTSTAPEQKEQALKPPAIYKVLLFNDDYTPMEFVVMILRQYLSRNQETAAQIILTVHREGKGVCGLYTRDITTAKAELVSTHARQTGCPLQCVIEEA